MDIIYLALKEIQSVFPVTVGRAVPVSEIVNLPLNQNGEFTEEWPGGFFDEGFDELFGASDAG